MMQPETLGISRLKSRLKQADIDLDAEQIADLLWLAVQISKVENPSVSLTRPETPVTDAQTVTQTPIKTPPYSQLTPPIKPTPSSPAASAYLPNSPDSSPESSLESSSLEKTDAEGIPFQAPTAPGLRKPLALARALRPLMRKVPSQSQTVIDEEETVTQIVEKEIWTPVLKPAPERWLELALVVEEFSSTVIWQDIIVEFQRLTELQGAFRDVRTWSLKPDNNGVIKLFSQWNVSVDRQQSRSPKELIDPTGRRLIVVISDCISPLWRQGKIHPLLKRWSNSGSVAIVQLLPERLWERTALGAGFPIQLSAWVPGVANHQLVVDGLPIWEEVNLANALTLPVVTLEPDSLKQWSQVVAGVGSTQTAGILWDLSWVGSLPLATSTTENQLSAEDLVKRFRTTASPTARRLAGLMAAVPVSLPVVYLLQETLLKESMQVHVAEVFMSGLLQPVSSPGEIVQYEFIRGVRELLLDSVSIPDVETVLEVVSQYIADKLGISIKNFTALLSPYSRWDQATEAKIIPFARIATQVLYRLGGEYAALAQRLERSSGQPSELNSSQLPPLQTFEFDVATVELEAETQTTPRIDLQPETETTPRVDLQPFEFEVGTIGLKQTDWFRRKTKLIIQRRQRQAWEFIEELGNGVQLELVAILGGSFLMGSPEDELERRSSESPQHPVTVQSFLMGKYPVTQAQWQAVAALPQINHKLKSDPSDFKGADRPVENVSWYDAVEFCARLSQQTGRPYRLPSEAEWEYACRAGTTTPFHFGETITPELANYNGNVTYGKGVKGEYREQTTPVGSFGVGNEFGLYDMHGNVWEWCADHWHNNYEGAPSDGSVWEDDNNNQNHYWLLRGGSWVNNPADCRCAFRYYDLPGDLSDYNIGFRVVCAAAWTL